MSGGPKDRRILQYATVSLLMQASTALSRTPTATVQPERNMYPLATPAGLRGAAAAFPALHSGSSQECQWPAGWQNSGAPTAPGGKQGGASTRRQGWEECRRASMLTGWTDRPTLASGGRQALTSWPAGRCRLQAVAHRSRSKLPQTLTVSQLCRLHHFRCVQM